MERFFEGLDGVKVGIICGKGNNGGDGLALARRLRIRGVPVRVCLLATFAVLKGEAKLNLAILRKMDVEIIPNASSPAIAEMIAWSDVLVDAMLGVGLSSPLKGNYAIAAELMNMAGRPVVAVDIPTGVNADTGEVMGSAVRADLTVTMVLPKRGLVLYPGAAFAGQVRVADIGIPTEVIAKEGIQVGLLEHGLAWGLTGERDRDSHKGDFGHLMIIAGSLGKAGAAMMAAKGALRTGAGLVSVAAPMGIIPIIQQQVMEAMCIPAGESIDGTLGIGSENELLKASGSMTACAIGPGLTTHYETVQVVKNLVQRMSIPLVIDADGVNALAGFPGHAEKGEGARCHDAPSRGNGEAPGRIDRRRPEATGSALHRLCRKVQRDPGAQGSGDGHRDDPRRGVHQLDRQPRHGDRRHRRRADRHDRQHARPGIRTDAGSVPCRLPSRPRRRPRSGRKGRGGDDRRGCDRKDP